MFDVFQNVLFGKKKSNAESEKEKPDSEDFVLLGNTSNEPVPVKNSDSNPGELLFPKNPYGANLLGDKMPQTTSKKEETYLQIMPLQDVPFAINSNLYASAKLDQIWQSIAPNIANIGNSYSYQVDYDFALEKSVISETAQK